MTWQEIVQQFIDNPPPALTQGNLAKLNAGDVDYATARNIVQLYSLPIAGNMTQAYQQLPANVRSVTFSSTASQPAGQQPGITGDIDPATFTLAILDRVMGGIDGAPPLGWYETRQEAITKAQNAYGLVQWDAVAGIPLVPYDIIGQNGFFTFIDKKGTAPDAEERFSLIIDPRTGDTVAFNPTDPLGEKEVVFKAANKAPYGSIPIGKKIPLGNGKFMQPYTITDKEGNTVRTNVVIEPDTQGAPTEGDIIKFSDAEGGGRLIPLGEGRYTYEAPPDAPFTLGPDAAIPLPEQGGSLIKISKNQYQFVRDTYEPGIVQDPLTGRYFNQSASGTWTELDPRADPGVVESGGREFLQQYTGALTELDPRYDPEVTDVEGMKLLQQRSGQIGQLTPPNLDQIITQALVDGEYDKAFAFQDFQQRPTAQEAFETALAFARSPADQRIISAIARGITPVQPPPEGTIQRVGPQPDFLVQAYQDFQRRTQAGRAPTEEEATSLSARAAAGQTPLSDTLQIQNETLQTRLEALTRDQDRKDEKHALEMQGMRQSQDEQAQIFKTKNNIAMGLNADGTPKSSSSTASGNGLFGGTEVTGDSGPTGDSGTVASSQENMSLVWGQLNDAQKAFFTDHFTRNKGRVPVGAEALTDFYMPDITQFEERVKYHLSGIPVGDPAGPPVASGLGNQDEAGIFYEEPPAVEPTPTPAVDPLSQHRFDEDPMKAILGSQSQRIAAGTLGQTGDPLIPGLHLRAGSKDYPSDLEISKGNIPAITPTYYPPSVTRIPNFSDLPSPAQQEKDILGSESQRASGRLGLVAPQSSVMEQNRLDAVKQIREIEAAAGLAHRAGGGTVQPGEITVVGEQGPEIAMMPPGTHILPLGKATKKDIRAAQSTGRAYQQGGIVFDELEPGLQQLWRGRPITPPRGYLFQQGGLPLPSPQALQNLTPGTRESFMGMAGDIGIFPAEFRQELQTATPRGTRLPTSRMLPLGRRGVR